MTDTTAVKPGQVWADNDKRAAERRLLVRRTDDRYAYCTPVGRPDARETRILIARMRPTSTGYRLLKDAPEVSR